MGRRLVIFPLCVLLACGLWAQKRKSKKDEEPPTQVLPPLPEPPEAVVAETGRLSFQVSTRAGAGQAQAVFIVEVLEIGVYARVSHEVTPLILSNWDS